MPVSPKPLLVGETPASHSAPAAALAASGTGGTLLFRLENGTAVPDGGVQTLLPHSAQARGPSSANPRPALSTLRHATTTVLSARESSLLATAGGKGGVAEIAPNAIFVLALLTPEVNPGSLYRCRRSSYEQFVGHARGKGPREPPKNDFRRPQLWPCAMPNVTSNAWATPTLRNITFDNIMLLKRGLQMMIQGLPTSPITGVRVRNVLFWNNSRLTWHIMWTHNPISEPNICARGRPAQTLSRLALWQLPRLTSSMTHRCSNCTKEQPVAATVRRKGGRPAPERPFLAGCAPSQASAILCRAAA